MGFYNTINKISQSLFFFILGEGGPGAHKHRLKKKLIIYLTGYGILCYKYFIDKKSIERRDKMSKETLKETVKKITHLDSMKAVKVAFDLSESNQDSINKVMQIVGGNVDNINLLAQRINDLEIKVRNLSDEQRKN